MFSRVRCKWKESCVTRVWSLAYGFYAYMSVKVIYGVRGDGTGSRVLKAI